MKRKLCCFLLCHNILLADFYSFDKKHQVCFNKDKCGNSIDILELSHKIKPSIIIVKKTNCKYFKKWNYNFKHDEQVLINKLFKDFNVIILDNKLDNIPEEFKNKISPTFFLIDNEGIDGEINGLISVAELLETFDDWK